MKKIAVFVDVQNIYYTTKQQFGRQFNYRAFWRNLSEEGEIVMANAYAIARDDEGQKRFQTALRSIGFNVKLKPYIQRSDGSAKGDWDVGITLDVIDAAKEVDMIVLLSGDGDFSLLLNKIRAENKVDTHVYGVRALTAQTLIQSSNKFTDIESDLLL